VPLSWRIVPFLRAAFLALGNEECGDVSKRIILELKVLIEKNGRKIECGGSRMVVALRVCYCSRVTVSLCRVIKTLCFISVLLMNNFTFLMLKWLYYVLIKNTIFIQKHYDYEGFYFLERSQVSTEICGPSDRKTGIELL
jgi:hypothetical protein